MTQDASLPDLNAAADRILAGVRLRGLFTPASPVADRRFLAGRVAEINRTIEAVQQPGKHVVLYGERGVGKTSLAMQVHQIWTDAFKDVDAIVAARVQCDPQDTYSSIWQKATAQLQLEFDAKGIKPDSNGRFAEAMALTEAGDATPSGIATLLRLTGRKLIIVVDEFELIEDDLTTAMMASTIKTLSDYLVDATLIIVGVAESVDELIDNHQSIERNLEQILIPPMSIDDLKAIVTTRLDVVDMSITPNPLLRIAAFSQGRPYYTHLLGLHAAQNAVRNERLGIDSADVDAAKKQAVSGSLQTVIAEYNSAITSPRKDALFRQTLLACAMTKPDDLGYFAPADVKGPMELIMEDERSISSFMKRLHALTRPERGGVLQCKGDVRALRFRFANPLLRPYVIMRGIDEDMIREPEVYQHSDPATAEQLRLPI